MVQPDPAARAFSSFHHEDTYRCSQGGTALSSTEAGGGTAAVRMPAVTHKPAQRAAATSSIETVQQARRLADPGEPRIRALGHSLERTNPMPPAVGAERDQFPHYGSAAVQAGDN